MTIQEIIEIIEKAFTKDERVKSCYKFRADKCLQIQLFNEENFNINVVKLDDKAYVIKRL